ncbi:SRPBCC family protein [Nocardioides sp. SYSU DS0651]|uniref:SRPBCC family protein n=1 Tax=Nocardioides sp. SYSU DS0651 TaxID=3415955 RepID=UPI003F4C4A05
MSRHLLRIAAPPQVAFDYLAEPRNRPQWQSSLRAVQMLTTGPTRLGTRWVDRTTIGARPTLEITAMSPPSAKPSVPGVWSEVGRWRGLTASLTLTVHPVAADPAATDVGVDLSLAGRGAWRAPAGVLRLLAPTAVRADLHRAARRIEAAWADGPGTSRN